jgi:two-component system sensor histidine kinase KdpD
LFTSALQRLEATARSRVKFTVPTALPAARGDRALLEQTLINLLENALKYSPVTAPILLSAEQRNGRVRIVVADTGPGIEPAERARIFDFFYRAAQRDSGVAGSGLGLAICKGFVEAMGGKISVQAGESGQGTMFVIELPVDETELNRT